jgi:hypothetical protein
VEGGGFSAVVRSGFGGGRRGKCAPEVRSGIVAREAAALLGPVPLPSVLGLSGAAAKIDEEGLGGAAASTDVVFGEAAPPEANGFLGAVGAVGLPIGRIALGTIAPELGGAADAARFVPVVLVTDGPRLTPAELPDVSGRGMSRGGRSEGKPIVTIFPQSSRKRQHVCWG